MMRVAFILAFLIGSAATAEEGLTDAAAIRAAIEKSLPLLQQGAKAFRERSEGRCIACHHQGLVLQTVALARERRLAVDESLARAEVDRVHGFYIRRQGRYLAALKDPAAAKQADPFGNFTVHAGYWLWGLAAEKTPRDEFMATTVRLLATKQWDDGRWSFADTARAPMQASDFTTTALAAFALGNYGSSNDAQEFGRRLDAAKDWLLRTSPRTIDDKAFRLFGLDWTKAPTEDLQAAAEQLLAEQRADGGWAQQKNMPTDAYATGLSLVALAQAAKWDVSSTAYGRGVAHLIERQQTDGSWFVRTRAIPTNPYFESGFPHGKSQFISYAGTCWATQALLLCRPRPPMP